MAALSFSSSFHVCSSFPSPFLSSSPSISLRHRHGPVLWPVAASRTPPPSPAAPPKPKSARGSGLRRPLDISPALQQFMGAPQACRAETMKVIWEYIKSHNLQSQSDKRIIVCDEALKGLLGKDEVGFLELAKLLNPHFLKST